MVQAAGCILAHKTKLPGRVLKKGHHLTQEDCDELAAQGIDSLVIARLDPQDIGEDAAAERLAQSAMGPGVSPDDAFTGRMNLYADRDGVLVVDAAAITAANRIDPAITFATLPNHSKVGAGRMVATAKIISFALPEDKVSAAEAALAKHRQDRLLRTAESRPCRDTSASFERGDDGQDPQGSGGPSEAFGQFRCRRIARRTRRRGGCRRHARPD